ncbi:general transcription factor II-I repeat domain-containing protein 2A [Trichonephila clavipes]|nr:general transcription factor II-I repeat domain-containing protein 2A [Trichonephila clavipes]
MLQINKKNDINSAPFISLCLDESIDITKSAHLAVFARYCVENIIKEELIAITSLLTTTKGTGHSILECHCIIHQQALGAKSGLTSLDNVITLVTKIVNLISSQALNKRKFDDVLDEVNSVYNGLIMYNTMFAGCAAGTKGGTLTQKGSPPLVYADKPQTLDHLEDNIRRVIADIRPQMLEKVIENWTSRLDYIRASRGSHMPELTFKM